MTSTNLKFAAVALLAALGGCATTTPAVLPDASFDLDQFVPPRMDTGIQQMDQQMVRTDTPVVVDDRGVVVVPDGQANADRPVLADRIATGDATAGRCGNGSVNLDEDCDDANTDDGDGCSSTCHFESSCATPIDLNTRATVISDAGTGRRTITLPWSYGLEDLENGSCGDDGPEIVYSYTATGNAILDISTSGSDGDTVLSVFRNCVDSGSGDAGVDAGVVRNQLACDDDQDFKDVTSRVLVSVTAGQTIFIRFERYNSENADPTDEAVLTLSERPTLSIGDDCSSGTCASGSVCYAAPDAGAACSEPRMGTDFCPASVATVPLESMLAAGRIEYAGRIRDGRVSAISCLETEGSPSGVIHSFRLPYDARVSANISGGITSLAIRRFCLDSGIDSEISCGNFLSSGSTIVAANTVLYFIVQGQVDDRYNLVITTSRVGRDGDECLSVGSTLTCGVGLICLTPPAGDAGDASVVGVCRAPVCGDRLVQSSIFETCDDGNSVADDGCNECVQSSGTEPLCAAAPSINEMGTMPAANRWHYRDTTFVPVNDAGVVRLDGGFASSAIRASCAFGQTGSERVYTWVAPADGRVDINTNGSINTDGTMSVYDTILHVHSSCNGRELDCDDDDGDGNNSLITNLRVTAGQRLFIWVDSFNTTTFPRATIEVDVTWSPPSVDGGVSDGG